MKKKRAFIIGPIRGADPEMAKYLKDLKIKYEKKGYIVHLPQEDTDQDGFSIDICKQNGHAIDKSDVVIIAYAPDSQGTHFDMGYAFAKNKKIIVEKCEIKQAGKCYGRMLMEWEYEGWHQ